MTQQTSLRVSWFTSGVLRVTGVKAIVAPEGYQVG
jgi:hypothetical protein